MTEAHDLVEAMAGCLLQGTSLAALEQLGAAREREWHKLLGFNVQFDAKPNAPAWLREHARQIVPALPVSGQDLHHDWLGHAMDLANCGLGRAGCAALVTRPDHAADACAATERASLASEAHMPRAAYPFQ